MRLKIKLICLILPLCLLLTGCNGCSKQSETSWADGGDYYYSDNSEYTEYKPTADDGSIKIAYSEQYGNTITIPVKINGMGLDMIFDTGASSTCITLAEANYMYEKGKLAEDDIIDIQQFQSADGSISVGLRINLQNIVIDNQIYIRDVEALVVENQQAPLLLGQSVMKLFREISVDRENGVVKFFK
ncbi:MAG: retroviral-like aspartic protease family protein [Dysgonamonadaceae bacterium]|jgi:aspartyl protease family protein|nr:retroviral-like aspartic protease family protein [Dysgonamonadaceae bacterium]